MASGNSANTITYQSGQDGNTPDADVIRAADLELRAFLALNGYTLVRYVEPPTVTVVPQKIVRCRVERKKL